MGSPQTQPHDAENHEAWPTEESLAIPGDVAAQMWRRAGTVAADLEPWVNTPGEAKQTQRIVELNAVADSIKELLPPGIQKTAYNFSKTSSVAGALVIRGLKPPPEVTAIEPEPGVVPDNIIAGRTTALVALAVSSAFGTPISYRTYLEEGSTITRGFMRSVAPQPDNQKPLLDSDQGIGWHTEGVTPLRPAIVALFGIRGDARTKTAILPAERVIERLSAETVEVLSEPEFCHTTRSATHGSDRQAQPVITTIAGRQALALLWARGEFGTRPFDDDNESARVALKELSMVLDDPKMPVTYHSLQPGELLAFDNTGLHARTPLMDGSNRWMLRTYVGGPQHNQLPVVNPS